MIIVSESCKHSKKLWQSKTLKLLSSWTNFSLESKWWMFSLLHSIEIYDILLCFYCLFQVKYAIVDNVVSDIFSLSVFF